MLKQSLINFGPLQRLLILVATLVVCAGSGFAQTDYPTVFPRPVVVLDQEALFNDSKLGQAILLAEAENRTVLLQENRIISDAFEEEEAELTAMRSTISTDEFHVLSEDFDKRVRAAREEQLSKDVELQQKNEARRRRFLWISAPYLSEIMSKYRAVAILDQRSVLLFDRNMDITLEAIELLDRAFEENPNLAIEEE